MNLSSITQITTTKIAPGAITDDLLNSSITKTVPTGAVMAFAMNLGGNSPTSPIVVAPPGWLVANGARVSRVSYSALFSKIGTVYGAGDGTSTFDIPDLRGYFVRGFGTNGDGTASGAFGADQPAYAGYNTFTAFADDGDSQTGSFGAINDFQVNGIDIINYPKLNSSSGAIDVPTKPGDTRPKNIAMLYCIKF